MGHIIRDEPSASRLRPESGTESALCDRTLRLAETPTAHSPTWDELTRWISPRRVVRVDSDGDHTYARVHYVAAGEPQGVPYALHLTTTSHRYAHVVFDLDTGRHPDGVGAVWRDANTLLEHLDAQGLEHVVAESGPAGGIHVWVPVADEDGLDADDVKRLARAAARHLPSLDIGMLCNPATGAVRPPGAPHRNGGRARLLHPAGPIDALAVFRTRANTAVAFERLALALGVEDLEAEQAEVARESGTRIDHGAMRLRGRRRPMPDRVRLLLDSGAMDASAHLFSVFIHLALARWSRADVRELVKAEPDAPGLEHLRTARSGTGRRLRRPEESEAVLERQWQRAVESAAAFAPASDRAERDATVPRALAAQALEAVADPVWWTAQAGQADRRALLAVHLVALTACVVEVDVDVRRVAEEAGIGRSTAHRALERLCRDGRLTRISAGEGQHSARYRLLPRDQWIQGGTQGEPTPGGEHPQGSFLPSREDLLTRLRDRLEQAQHDVWAEWSPTHPRGLGRHVELTYTALTEWNTHLDTVNLEVLAARTGYSTATTASHLRILAEHGLIHRRTLRPRTPAVKAMGRAAARLGTKGVSTARRLRHTAERAVFAAWQDELTRMRTPLALRPRTRRSERYARTPAGRPDHAAELARRLAA